MDLLHVLPRKTIGLPPPNPAHCLRHQTECLNRQTNQCCCGCETLLLELGSLTQWHGPVLGLDVWDGERSVLAVPSPTSHCRRSPVASVQDGFSLVPLLKSPQAAWHNERMVFTHVGRWALGAEPVKYGPLHPDSLCIDGRRPAIS